MTLEETILDVMAAHQVVGLGKKRSRSTGTGLVCRTRLCACGFDDFLPHDAHVAAQIAAAVREPELAL